MAAFVTETFPDSVYTYIHTYIHTHTVYLLAAALLTTKIVSTHSLFLVMLH